jgi:cytochrome c oxidase subunit 1
VRSESPAFDLHHPEVAALEMVESEGLRKEKELIDAPNVTGRKGHLEQELGGTDVEDAAESVDPRRDEDGR